MKTSLVIFTTVCLNLVTSRRLITRSVSDNEIDNNSGTNIFDSSWVNIKPKVKDVKAIAGEYITIECEASGSPQPVIHFFDDVTALNEKRKKVPDVEYTNTGLVKAKAKLHLIAKDTRVIFCRATSGSKTAHAAINLIVSSSKLTFLSNSIWEYENKAELIKRKAPKISFFDKMYLDDIGNTVVLPCTAIGEGARKLIWLDPKENVIEASDDKRFAISPFGDLRIRSIEWSDMGIYTCVVENHFGKDSITTFLYPMLVEN